MSKEIVIKPDDVIRIMYPDQFDQVERIRGNRPINKYHVDNLEEAIKEKAKRRRRGFSMFLIDPIKINTAGKLIDGQHRLALAERLRMPIKYIVENATLEDVIAENTGRRNWTLTNYLDAYIERGNKSYIIIKDFCTKYNLPLNAALKLLGKKNIHIRLYNDTFKSGTFELGDILVANRIGRYIQDYRIFLDENIIRSSPFCQSVRYIYEVLDIDHSRIVKHLQSMNVNYIASTSIAGHLLQLERIYNYHKSRDIIRFEQIKNNNK